MPGFGWHAGTRPSSGLGPEALAGRTARTNSEPARRNNCQFLYTDINGREVLPGPPTADEVGFVWLRVGCSTTTELETSSPPEIEKIRTMTELQLEQMRVRCDDLQKQISEVRDTVISLTQSVVYRDDEPYQAMLAKHHVSSAQRAALWLGINALLARAMGEDPVDLGENELTHQFPTLLEAHQKGPVDLATAIRIVGSIVGTQSRAIEFLDAHRLRGYAPEAHAALGL